MGLCHLDSRIAPVKPEFKVPLRSHILGGSTINKLIALGGQVPLHFSVPLSPLVRWQHNVCLHWLYKFPGGKAFSCSFLSIVALFQQHPSHPYNVGKGPKAIISPAQRLVQWPRLESTFLVIGIKNMLSNRCSETLTCVQLFFSSGSYSGLCGKTTSFVAY